MGWDSSSNPTFSIKFIKFNRCVTKYYKTPHRHKIHVTIWWTIVTQNTHLIDFKKHMVTLINTFGHFGLIVCDEIPKKNNRCVTKSSKMPHILYIHVAKWRAKDTLKNYSCDYKVFTVTKTDKSNINSYQLVTHFMVLVTVFKWIRPLTR